MTPQELKNSILQLAIQGKLVEQRPDEGTGEELYQQIQAEKQRLIKEGKIKKEKPLPEISEDEIPFDIPESWKWVRLGDIYRITMGQSPDGESVSENTYGIEFHQGKVFFGEDYLQKSNQVTNKPTKIAEPYSVLLCVRAPVGIVNITEREICIGRGLCAISTYGSMDVKYVLYSLRSFKSDFIKKATGTTFAAITGEVVKNQLVPLPPLAEQKRIVTKIEELLPYIERYEKTWSKLEELNKRFPTDLQKSILQLAIQGKLVEQRPEEGTGDELYQQIQDEKQRLIKEGKIKKEKPLPEISVDEIPFDIPESWKWVRVSSIVTLNPKNDIHDDTEVGFVPMPLVSDGFKNQHTFEIKKWKNIKSGFTHFANNDIGIAKITPCFQNRKSVIFKDLPNGFGAGTTELSIVRVINDSLCREYLLWFFKTDYFITNGVKSFTGTAGQQRIHKDYLATCLIPLPPLAEQKRIVKRLEEILPLCEKLKK